MLVLLGILILLLIVWVTLVECPARVADRPAPVAGVVDMHVHVAGIGAGGSGCHVSKALRSNWRYKSYLKAFGVDEAEMLEKGDAIVIEKIAARLAAAETVSAAVILALDGVVDYGGALDLAATEVYIPNDFVSRESARHPNLYYGASINPYRSDALDRLAQAAADGAVLIKWLPAIQLINPADEELIPFYKKLVEYDLPLLTHAGHERSFSKADARLGDPELLRLPMSLGVRVIAAHAATTGKSAGEDNMQRFLKMIPDYPNLYGDISSLTQLNKLIYLPKLLAHKEVHERLLYGTDFPLINTPLVSAWFYLGRLSLREALRISKHSNPWDRDVLLKRALAVPPSVFTRSAELLGIVSETETH